MSDTELPGIDWSKYKKPLKKQKEKLPHELHPYVEWTPSQYERDYMYHVSPKENREGIESKGLLRSRSAGYKAMGEADGVFVAETPEEDYGDDVYAVHVSGRQTGRNSIGHTYLTRSVGTSSLKRVGHITRNSDGHPEVHWHREEDCPSGKK